MVKCWKSSTAFVYKPVTLSLQALNLAKKQIIRPAIPPDEKNSGSMIGLAKVLEREGGKGGGGKLHPSFPSKKKKKKNL